MYMEKLSQVELLQLDEAFSDYLKGALKLAGRGALAATKGIAKTITPTGYGLVKKAGDAAGKAIANVALENPVNVLRAMLNSSDGRKTIKNGKIGAERKLPGGYREIDFEGEWISDPRQPSTPFKTKVVMVKDNDGQWKLAGNFNKNTGEFVFNNKQNNGKGGIPVSNTQGQGKNKQGKQPKTQPKTQQGKQPKTQAGGRSKASTSAKKPTSKQPAAKKQASQPSQTPQVQSNQTPQVQSNQTPQASKPKFFEALRDWKKQNIGPEAGSVGIPYAKLKEFLKTLNVEDPDRVLRSAGIENKGNRSIPNKDLGNVETTLKSRGIVSESNNTKLSQLELINLFNF